jgi:DNA-binding HxlR family transcriptional regulator
MTFEEHLPAVCDSSCPVRKTASIIEGKWTTLIIRDLLGGEKRFSELLRSLDGISPKVLTERLKFLEQRNLVFRTVYPVVPPKTEYRLTEMGEGLKDVIIAMSLFGQNL